MKPPISNVRVLWEIADPRLQSLSIEVTPPESLLPEADKALHLAGALRAYAHSRGFIPIEQIRPANESDRKRIFEKMSLASQWIVYHASSDSGIRYNVLIELGSAAAAADGSPARRAALQPPKRPRARAQDTPPDPSTLAVATREQLRQEIKDALVVVEAGTFRVGRWMPCWTFYNWLSKRPAKEIEWWGGGVVFDVFRRFWGTADSGPSRGTRLSSFAIAKFLVTHDQFKQLLDGFGRPSSAYTKGSCPVEVSFEWARTYAAAVGGRLATDEEWEVAASGGAPATRWAGTDDRSALGEFAWFYNNRRAGPQPVGQKKPNRLGAYDFSGNVREWCAGYSARGGGWLDTADDIRNTERYAGYYSSAGIRVVFDLAEYESLAGKASPRST